MAATVYERDNSVGTGAVSRFAPLQKSRRNHPSHVRREALSSIVLAGAFAQAIPQWIQGRDPGTPPPYF